MKIAVLSDLHGNLPTIEPCDYVFICGDISPLHIQRNIVLMREWLINDFATWVNNLPCIKVIMTGGNHDYVLLDIWNNDIKHAKYIIYPTGNKLKLLENNCTEIYDDNGNEYLVWGSPNCEIFGNWPFMYEPERNKKDFNTMPHKCDFALTHTPPYGACDVVLQETRWPNKGHIGSPALAEAIIENQPTYLFCGHIHSGNHECEMLGNTKVYNVSILDENYEYTYPIKYITI